MAVAEFLSRLVLLLACALCIHARAVALPVEGLDERQTLPPQALSKYDPEASTCPSTPLVRAANGISSAEARYISERKPIAAAVLRAWLRSLNFNGSTSNVPSVGLTTSGGGYRSLLSGAGVVQAFDARDSKVGTSGVYQGLTYHGGLSGGGWLLSSLAGNNWPTVTSLKDGLWEQAFQNGLFVPGGPTGVAAAQTQITNDNVAKTAAGFPVTLTDPWGRLLSYQLLYGDNGGVTERVSGIAGERFFEARAVPYPIITAIEVEPGQCVPTTSSPQFEIHPYEFGSWDSGIAAFAQTAYVGSNLTNGQPTVRNRCIQNFDNLGYVLGTSSHLFNLACAPVPQAASSPLIAAVAPYVTPAHALAFRDQFAVYPNPFYAYTQSSGVSSQRELYLVDGGLSNQNNPIWPFIQPARSGGVDVLIVNDNSADTADNFPDGTAIYTTYTRAQQVGLARMPRIPPVSTFVAEGLNKRATFFGCNDRNVVTIVYIPNVNYTFPSNQPTAKLQYTVEETNAMIANGVQIGTQNGDPDWPACLACAVMMNTGAAAADSRCAACFEKYCWSG